MKFVILVLLFAQVFLEELSREDKEIWYSTFCPARVMDAELIEGCKQIGKELGKRYLQEIITVPQAGWNPAWTTGGQNPAWNGYWNPAWNV